MVSVGSISLASPDLIRAVKHLHMTPYRRALDVSLSGLSSMDLIERSPEPDQMKAVIKSGLLSQITKRLGNGYDNFRDDGDGIRFPNVKTHVLLAQATGCADLALWPLAQCEDMQNAPEAPEWDQEGVFLDLMDIQISAANLTERVKALLDEGRAGKRGLTESFEAAAELEELAGTLAEKAKHAAVKAKAKIEDREES